MTSYTPISKASGDTLSAAEVTTMSAAVGSLAGESVAIVPRARIGTGTPGAGKYVDGGTGAWTDLPTGGGGGTAPGAWQEYVLDAGHTVDSSADNPKWRNMNDGTVQVYCGRVLAGAAVAANATYVATPAGFPALARQADFSNNIQIRVNGTLVSKSAASAGGQMPPNGQGNVFTVKLA